MKRVTGIVFGLLAAGCAAADDGGWRGSVDTLPGGTVVVRNPAAGLWDSASAWRLVETMRIGAVEGTGPEVLGRVPALEADAWRRVYVLEFQAREIRVFDADGGFVRSIGRSGSGPGEFRNPFGMAWDPDGRLWVADAGNARYMAFDTAGQYLTQRQRPAAFHRTPFSGTIDGDGYIYDTALEAGTGEEALIRFHLDSEASDTFHLPDDEAERFEIPQRVAVVVPFGARTIWTLDRRAHLWFGMSDSYRILERFPRGDTLRVVEKAFDPVPVTAEERDTAIARMSWFTEQGGRIDPSRIPDRKPAFESLYVDDRGYLWVRPTMPREDGSDGAVFDVFDPEGRYLGVARSDVPIQTYAPFVIRGRDAYAVVTDELDVPYVVRLTIEGR